MSEQVKRVTDLQVHRHAHESHDLDIRELALDFWDARVELASLRADYARLEAERAALTAEVERLREQVRGMGAVDTLMEPRVMSEREYETMQKLRQLPAPPTT